MTGGDLQIVARLKDYVSKGFFKIARNGLKMTKTILGGMKRLLSSVLSLKGALVGMAVYMAGKMFTGFIASAAKLGDKLAKMARSIGATTESLSAMQYAAELSGVSLDEFIKASLKLVQSAGKAKDMLLVQRKAFDDLGISVNDLRGSNINLIDVYSQIADGLQRYNDDTDKARILTDIFGRAGQKLLPMFKEGAAGIRAMVDEAERYGIVFDKDMLAVSEKFIDSQTRVKAAWTGLKVRLLNDIYPALTKIFNKLAKMIADNRDVIIKALVDIVKFTVEAVAAILKAMAGFAKKFDELRNKFGTTELSEARKHYDYLVKKLKAFKQEVKDVNKAIGQMTDKEIGTDKWYMLQKAAQEARTKIYEYEILVKATAEQIATIERQGWDRSIQKIETYKKKIIEMLNSVRQAKAEGAGAGGKVTEDDTTKPLSDFQLMIQGASKGLSEFAKQAGDVAKQAQAAMTSIMGGIADNLTSGIMDAITQTKSLKDAWKDTGKAILKMIMQIIIKMMIMKALSSTMGALGFGGGGGAAADGGGVPAWGGGSAMDAGGGVGSSRLIPAGATNVNFTIVANDTRGFDELLHKRRGLIEDIIAGALSRRRALITGVRGA